MADKGNVRAALAVFWSFFGVRKRHDYDEDAENLSRVQIIIAGLIGGVVFVLTLLLVVYLMLHFVK